MPKEVRHTVLQKKGDPYIYLYVMGEWYCYNPQEAPLGSGAMGDVYRGYRIKDNSIIAVKRVKDEYANNKKIRERARLEASLAFRHPNLVEMIGYCEYAPDHGPIFILSNFVHGEDIDVYLKKFSDPSTRIEKVSNAICQILDALDYVHSRGVIHRDIKPSNIMVENDANVRLMDLGISRMNGGNKFSQYGFIGTPEYSAPEQIKRDEGNTANAINATTDIYELGITFYELLTGNNPMSSQAEAETLANQISKRLPSDASIPKRLMSVIWKATEKEQAKRYQSAMEMKLAIKAAIAPEPSMPEKLKDWLQQHAMAIFCVFIGLAVILFIITIILI